MKKKIRLPKTIYAYLFKPWQSIPSIIATRTIKEIEVKQGKSLIVGKYIFEKAVEISSNIEVKNYDDKD